jgi:phosphoribosyl 1,2-cyclic phosphodiesterase
LEEIFQYMKENRMEVGSGLSLLPSDLTTLGGTNTPCLELETDTESEYLLCDAGTGIRDFSQEYFRKKRSKAARFHLFLTHLHWDHIQGFPFFGPAYLAGNTIVIHGCHDDLEESFKKQMSSPCFPVPFRALQAKIVFDIRDPGEVFEACGYKIHAIRQNHPNVSFGYRFEKEGKLIVYSTDCEHVNEVEGGPFVDFFRNADVLIFDAMYSMAEAGITKENWGHSHNLMGVELALQAGVKHLVLFHRDPAKTDEQLKKFLGDTVRYVDLYGEELGIANSRQSHKVSLAHDGWGIEV